MTGKHKALAKRTAVKDESPSRMHLKKTVKRGRAIFKGVSHETGILD